ncbi:MAG: hypothetical protein DDG59_00075 [Anaerolineae bacterium]|nr:MAG: hypothetical protein DDG59_00075 [Anaerolineae bacterium]
MSQSSEFQTNHFEYNAPNFSSDNEMLLDEKSNFLEDALILVDNFFRTISGIHDIQTYITIFRVEDSPLFVLKDQKLVTTSPTSLINDLITEVMKNRSTVLLTDTSPKSPEILGKSRSSSWLAAPLIQDNQIIGVILIQGPKSGLNFSESDKQILGSFTKPISNLIQTVSIFEANRRLLESQYQEVQSMTGIQRDLAKFTDKLLETLDVDLVLQTSVTELRELFDLAEVEIQLRTD